MKSHIFSHFQTWHPNQVILRSINTKFFADSLHFSCGRTIRVGESRGLVLKEQWDDEVKDCHGILISSFNDADNTCADTDNADTYTTTKRALLRVRQREELGKLVGQAICGAISLCIHSFLPSSSNLTLRSFIFSPITSRNKTPDIDCCKRQHDNADTNTDNKRWATVKQMAIRCLTVQGSKPVNQSIFYLLTLFFSSFHFFLSSSAVVSV